MTTAKEIFLFILFLPVLIHWAAQWIFHVGAILYGKWLLHRKPKLSPVDASLPGVSILKPLSGVDANLVKNLESFFTMPYPKYELLFCVEQSSDEAYPLVLQLLEKYPNVDARVFVGGRDVGINPKINNMILGYEAAKYKLLLISDAGLLTDNDTLLSMVECLTEEVGMVHQMPYSAYQSGFPAALVQLYFGTHHSKGYLFSNLIGVNCSSGMSCLFRKELLDRKGGIQEFGKYLAEDFHFSVAILEMGYKSRVCPIPCRQNSVVSTTMQFHDRMIRWMKLRMSLMPFLYLVEPLSGCFVQGALMACAFAIFLDWSPYVYLVLHILLWIILDFTLMNIVEGGPIQLSKQEFLQVWFHAEFYTFQLFLRSLLSPNIKWKSNEYRLKWNGIGELIGHSNGIHHKANGQLPPKTKGYLCNPSDSKNKNP